RMGTLVAVETDGGAAIAGDRRVTDDGVVESESAERVFGFEVDSGSVGAGALGESGDPGEFRRRLRAELEEANRRHQGPIDVDVLGRVAARAAERTDVEAVVAARDGDGVARIRRVGADGSVLSGEAFALGSGAGIALGRLEAADPSRDLESTESLVREVLATVASRDAATGEAVEVWSLASDPDGD
ncbi:MAG: 20S proteasome subunit A/B, partial [Haloferacaceae archaeon]